MYKFMIATFLLLGWGFYEMSGGSEFEPEQVAFVQETEPKLPRPEMAASIASTVQSKAEPALPTPELQAGVKAITTSAPKQSETIIPASLSFEPTVVPDAVEKAIEAALETTLTPEPESVDTDLPDLRAVAGSWVNMRSGPGTDFDVLDTLPRGTEAEVLDVNAAGWARIRIIGSGQIGWMAERLLETL